MLITALIIPFLALVPLGSASRLRGSFDQFLPGVSTEISAILKTKCWAEYQAYRNETISLYGTQCVKTYSCIMEEVSEYTKANMASSAVLLGLTPWILSALGSTSSEIALVSTRRPGLIFWLVLGSPAINPTRSSVYRDPFDEHLKLTHGQKLLPILSPARNTLYVIVEFVLAIGSATNLGMLSWKLALNAIPVMSCDSDMLVGLWIGLAFITHLLGLATFFARAELPQTTPTTTIEMGRFRYWISKVKNEFRSRYRLINEFQHGANQPPLDLTWGKETWTFLSISWITTTYTITHLAFGTLVLSSLSFIGIEDATIIAARFMGSAIVSRKIIALELAGMRSAHFHHHKEDIDGARVFPMQVLTAQTQTTPSQLERGESRASVEITQLAVKPEHRAVRHENLED